MIVPSALAPPATLVNRAGVYYVLFFFSGFPALLYQIVWQRALFTIYGVNIESVTAIVTVFMLGLGLGSLGGGWLSKRPSLPMLAVFGAVELGIAVFGAFSLRVFQTVASFTAGASPFQTGLVTFILLFVPTFLMGTTLPLLTAYLVSRNRNVGESVGSLYCVNTFGSGVACFVAAHFLMRALGESGSVRVAAGLNVCVAITALLLHLRAKQAFRTPYFEPRSRTPNREILPLSAGLLLAGSTGFIALGYEIVWYRLYSFASGRSAAGFALLLGWYLAGVAYGSLRARDLCRGRLRDDLIALVRVTGTAMVWASIAAFLVAPAVAAVLRLGVLEIAYPFVFIAAALLGTVFPLVSHACIDPATDEAGAKVSYLYLSNIIGCASGSYLVGFVAMDLLPVTWIAVVLLVIGLAIGFTLLLRNGRSLFTLRLAAGLTAAVLLLMAAGPLYSSLYERLLLKSHYTPGTRLLHISETRSGVVAIGAEGTVYGGGVYDGHISTDLIDDVNGIFRAYAIDALHSNPKDVLIVGLSMGAWAQIIANNPRVERLTIVEINPGYLNLIPKYPEVASLLRNPKVRIVIDDGRRWLIRNPEATFDVVVMNTSQHWLAHTSNLLSAEFLRLVRPHLKAGGIHYYNTTFSGDALLTGATIFPFALRVANFLAVSDSPIVFDKERWRRTLTHFRIDGKPVLDLDRPDHQRVLTEVLSLADTVNDSKVDEGMHLEAEDSLRRRFGKARLVTDDNMITEWR
jgi:spermidine synthase